MNKAARRTVAATLPSWLSLLLLLAGASLAPAQQPAPKASPPATQSQSVPSPAPESRDLHARVTETVIDSSITDDPAVDKMLDPYTPKVRALEVVIGKLTGELRKGGTGAGSLGNFVADGMRAQTKLKLGKGVDLAIINGGGLRRSAMGEGDLRARDIFELMPFENTLVTLELTGEQLNRLLGVVVSIRDGQAGARITYRTNADKKSELESAKLIDEHNSEQQIDPKATYTVVTIDYLIDRGGDTYAVLREGKNVKPVGITLRDAIMDYVKSETAAGRAIKPNLDRRFIFDRANSVLTEKAPPE